jgi:hypothetical protein
METNHNLVFNMAVRGGGIMNVTWSSRRTNIKIAKDHVAAECIYTNWAKEMSHRYYAPNSVATPKILIS